MRLYDMVPVEATTWTHLVPRRVTCGTGNRSDARLLAFEDT